MRGWVPALALALVSGCVESSSIICNGRVCPADSHCDEASGLCIPATCGNGVLDPSEDCEGTPTEDCTDYGYYLKGELACSPICKIDTSKCGATCGDRTINGPELCDGIPPAGHTCADFGFDVGRLACSPACGPGVEACAFIGWRPAPGGATNELRAISGPFAVGLGGMIIHASEDDVWTPMASPTQADLFGVWTGPNGAFAVGAGGTIVQFTASTGWTTMASPTTNVLYAVYGIGDQVFAVGAAGTILRYNGSAWSSMTQSPTFTGAFRGVWVDATAGYAVGDGGGIYKLQGGTWVVVAGSPTTAQLNAVFGIAGHVYVAGNAGVFAHYDPNTGSWGSPVPLPLPPTGALFAIWGSSPTNVFVAGTVGMLLHFNGAQLAEQGANTLRTIFGLWGNAVEHVYGVTRGGEVIEFNGTDRVDQQALPGTSTVNAVFSTSGVTATAVGTGAQIVEYNTQGLEAWNPPVTIAAAGAASLSSVWRNGGLVIVGADDGLYVSTTGVATNAFTKKLGNGILGVYGVTGPTGATKQVIAVGAGIYGSTDGITFTQQVPPTGDLLYTVWATSTGADWFAGGASGIILHGNGTTWTPMTSGVNVRVQSLWGTSAQDVYATGQAGVLIHYDGTAWHPVYTGSGENFLAIGGTSRGDVFAGGTNGILFHYDGVAWSRMSSASFGLVSAMAVGQQRSFFVGLNGGAEVFTRMCVPTEVRCDNPWDDDCDGLTNCDDPDCAGSFACVHGGACPTFEHLDCGQVSASTYTGIARIDELPCLTHSTPGPEASYKFKAVQSGPVTVTLTADDAMDLVVLDEQNAQLEQDGACAIQTCRAATGSGGTKAVTFSATAGSTYYLVVDGPLYTANDFTLALTVACP